MERKVVSQRQFFKDNKESVVQPFYDTVNFPAVLAAGKYQFFTNIAGKNRYLTNMNTAAQFAKNNDFYCNGIQLKFLTDAVTLADYENFFKLSQAVLTLKLLSKVKLEIPVDMIPGGNDYQYFSEGSAAQTLYLSNGWTVAGNMFKLPIKIEILDLDSFSVDIDVNVAGTLSKIIPVRIALLGMLRRPAQ